MLRWRLYRLVMKVAHHFNWHYAPGNRNLMDEHGGVPHWCKWCGLRGTTYDLSVSPRRIKTAAESQAQEQSGQTKCDHN